MNRARSLVLTSFVLCTLTLIADPGATCADQQPDSARTAALALTDSLIAAKYKFTTNLSTGLADSLHVAADTAFLAWCYHSATTLHGTMLLKRINVVQQMPGTIDWEMTFELVGSWRSWVDDEGNVEVSDQLGTLFWLLKDRLYVKDQLNSYEVSLIRKARNDCVKVTGYRDLTNFYRKLLSGMASTAPGNEWQRESAQSALDLHESNDVIYVSKVGSVAIIPGMYKMIDSGWRGLLPPTKLGVLTSGSAAEKAWNFIVGEK